MTEHSHPDHREAFCPFCQTHFVILHTLPPRFCPFCEASLRNPEQVEAQYTLAGGESPAPEKILFSVGTYQAVKKIGFGGMGEVFLAYDTQCGRYIALKRIRSNLMKKKLAQKRFLKEAHITGQLMHPAIIPIYAIEHKGHFIYYTMPYVEGQTLRQLLIVAHQQEKKGVKQDNISSIPALIRIFLSVCQAVAYAHDKQVIHRDLKPNNIIVGRFGEVLILDWGLAKLVSDKEENESEPSTSIPTAIPEEVTIQGKVAGTLAYLAPERALGNPATYQTDIYSLGVTLYQILTLRHPFHRHSLKDFRENMDTEVLYDPSEVAPHRDVPPILSRIVQKCLSPQLKDRYATMNELIRDLEVYLEGRSEWFLMSTLDIHKKSDWEFQENVLIGEHMAITRVTEVSEWVSLMIAHTSFPNNIRMEANVSIGQNGRGIGFLLSVPEGVERVHLSSGYCLWVGSDLNKTTNLRRSNVEVIDAPEIFLQRNVNYHVSIEKIDNNIHFYLNGILQFSYIGHLPLSGTHVGVIARDADFTLSKLSIFSGSHNIQVNCLAIPDAFLSHKHYAIALNEYRRISEAFPGTAESRDALFRAGVTLLEEARDTSDPKGKQEKSEEALSEFNKLHRTPGAPLEYLGKALVYQFLDNQEDELRCFELAFRRYPHHPLLAILYEQLIYRMHESARYDRKMTYAFTLLAVRHLPLSVVTSINTRRLFANLRNHWERLYFIEKEESSSIIAQRYELAIPLAFWLEKGYILEEIVNELSAENIPHRVAIENALFALIELGEWQLVKEKLTLPILKDSRDLFEIALKSHEKSVKEALESLSQKLETDQQFTGGEIHLIFYLLHEALQKKNTAEVHDLVKQIKSKEISKEIQLQIDCCNIWAYLLEKDWESAGQIFHKYEVEQLMLELTPLHFLYGCWLGATESREIAYIHLTALLEVPYPRTWTLLGHFIMKTAEEQAAWINKAFPFEVRQLHRQLALFHHCVGNTEQASSL